MPKLVKAKTVLTRFSDKVYAAIEDYAEDRGITRAEAVRLLVEESLIDRKVRNRNQASFERMLQINEFMFHSIIAQNEGLLSPEQQSVIRENTIKTVDLKHPRIDEDY